jgi:thiamine-phosphate pyrophosphorylase
MMAKSLPRLLLIADQFTDPERAERIIQAAQAGVRWVQLRDHAASDEVFSEAAGQLAQRLCSVAPAMLVSVNTRIDVASNLGAGMHFGHRGPSASDARQVLGPEVVLGFSAHDRAEGLAAVAAGVDYLTFSPVFPTTSKPGHSGTGFDALSRFCTTVASTPVYALGGITPDRVAPCRAAGARGIAVLSGILEADDPAQAVAAYRTALDASPASTSNP